MLNWCVTLRKQWISNCVHHLCPSQILSQKKIKFTFSCLLHLRVFSTYIKDIEDKPGPTAWGSKMPFGEVLLEHKDCGGWVHSVSFSPSGDQLAWVAHNSSITVVDAALGKE